MLNKFYVCGDEVFIKLSLLSGLCDWTIIDLIDFDKVNAFRGTWYRSGSSTKNNTFYALLDWSNRDRTILHQVILGDIPRGYEPDHKNRNGLDNRRENLRLITISQNMHNRAVFKSNTSGMSGVHYNKGKKKWEASITINWKRIYLGSFKSKEDAIEMRSKVEDGYIL